MYDNVMLLLIWSWCADCFWIKNSFQLGTYISYSRDPDGPKIRKIFKLSFMSHCRLTGDTRGEGYLYIFFCLFFHADNVNEVLFSLAPLVLLKFRYPTLTLSGSLRWDWIIAFSNKQQLNSASSDIRTTGK